MQRYVEAEGLAIERPIASVAELDALARRMPVTLVTLALVDALQWVVRKVAAKRDEMRTLAELDGLDDRMLADIGINRGEIAAVAANRNDRQVAA